MAGGLTRGGGREHGVVRDVMILSMAEVDRAVRASWAADTCSPDDAARVPWAVDNPAWGHCDVTALVVHDLFGGDLVLGEVSLDGEPSGYHWWNRLAGGVAIDLTREQFRLGQVVTPGRTVTRPPGPARRRQREYELFRDRALRRLTPDGGGSRPGRHGAPTV